MGCISPEKDPKRAFSWEGLPEPMVEGVYMDLLAKEPNIVTPTGVQVDEQNRIWVIENHTHVRQEDYPGPKVDRILVFEGYIGNGQEKRVTEFATGFIDGMSLSFSHSGSILITTRASIIEFVDENEDLVADRRDTLISLKTGESFPHNGMSGMAVHPDGSIYFQCGENFGANYTLTGRDGKVLWGKEREGGSLYHCKADGTHLERIGTAVWNCFAMTFDSYGNLFAVENDPDSRPPCRLLHIVRGGNYGFQFQHGRDGLSPLTSWFGEIPGTLPMVAGTGEAPSGVLYYPFPYLGEKTQGSLIVTAWGDNEIQHFHLEKKGSSFTAEPQSFVKGVKNFYPVGLAIDQEGGVVVTDWADVSYAVHGAGRIWRIFAPKQTAEIHRVGLIDEVSKEELIQELNSKHPGIRSKAANRIVADFGEDLTVLFQQKSINAPGKMNLIWATQAAEHDDLEPLLHLALEEEEELLRAAAVRSIVEQQIQEKESFFLQLIEEDTSLYVIREAIYGLKSIEGFNRVVEWFGKSDPFIHTALIETFGKKEFLPYLKTFAKSEFSFSRMGALLLLRKSGSLVAQSYLPTFLHDPTEEIRILALKWISEENLRDFRNEVESSFNKAGNMSNKLFDAYMVTFQYLEGEFNQKNHFMEGDEHVSQSFYKRQKFLIEAAKNKNLNHSIRARALAGINPNHPFLDLNTLNDFISEDNVPLQIEAIRSMAVRTEPEARQILREIARDEKRNETLRTEAIVGLGSSIKEDEQNKVTVLQLLGNTQLGGALKVEALRSLMGIAQDSELSEYVQTYKNLLPPADSVNSDEFWAKISAKTGDSLAGARTFFSSRYQCSSCHRIQGRGGVFGPDLSQVGGNGNRERIVNSILQPSAIISPTYTGYVVKTQNGETYMGRLDEDLDSKRNLQMILANNERAAVPFDKITEKSILSSSLMPMNLHKDMTTDEFRNLVTFLERLR